MEYLKGLVFKWVQTAFEVFQTRLKCFVMPVHTPVEKKIGEKKKSTERNGKERDKGTRENKGKKRNRAV